MKHKQVASLLFDTHFVMRRTLWTVIAIFAVIVLAIGIVLLTRSEQRTNVTLGGTTFSSRIAKTDASRSKGLAGVTNLAPNQAMLLAFKTDDKWQIWMKDMKISIDILWLDSDKKVIYIVNDAPFQNGTSTIYTPDSDARYVLELAAGTAKAKNIEVGQTASFTIKGAVQ